MIVFQHYQPAHLSDGTWGGHVYQPAASKPTGQPAIQQHATVDKLQPFDPLYQ